MKKKYVAILLTVLLSFGLITPSLIWATDDDENLSEGTTEFNTQAVKANLTTSSEDKVDLFGSSEPVEFNNQYFKIHLNYKIADYGVLAAGSKLKIELKPDGSSSYIQYPSSYAQNKSIKADNGQKLADVDISSNDVSAELTFPSIASDFTVDLNSSLELDKGDLSKYFEKNPDKENLEQSYYLYLNGIKQENKKITFTFPKPKPQTPEVDFIKTRGFYKRSGELGEGTMLYNIKVGTQLNKSNEFFIYDTPDVNLAFEDTEFTVHYAAGTNQASMMDTIFRASEGWKKVHPGTEESRMELELYDIYFLTEEATDASQPRQAVYEDQTLHLDRYNVTTGKQGLDSMNTAAVPKNILVEKPFGEALTTEEQAKIDQAGGLNKTVGKGFKLHIKNFSQPGYEQGGFFTLVFRMRIKNIRQKSKPLILQYSILLCAGNPYL